MLYDKANKCDDDDDDHIAHTFDEVFTIVSNKKSPPNTTRGIANEI